MAWGVAPSASAFPYPFMEAMLPCQEGDDPSLFAQDLFLQDDPFILPLHGYLRVPLSPKIDSAPSLRTS